MGACCASLIFPTNAHRVSKLRSLYSNEQLYKDVYRDPSLLQVPDAESGFRTAMQFLRENSFRKEDNEPYNAFGGLPEREKCGIGLYLHLFSLVYFGVFFAICSLIAVGPLVLDYQGGYGEKYEDQARYFPTLGNTLSFPEVCTLEEAQDTYEKLLFFQQLQVVFDGVYTFLFLVAILVYIVWTRRMIEIHRSRYPTLADYSIKITQLPEHRIPQFAFLLESMGLIAHEIVPVRHVNNLLIHFQALELRRSFQVLQVLSDHTDRYNYERSRVEETLGLMFSNGVEGKQLIEESHSAIVVFEDRQQRALALKRFRKVWICAWLRKMMTYLQKRLGWERNWLKELNAKWMSTPNEICWENIRKKRYGIRFFYYFATVLVILASASAIFALRSQQNDIDDNTQSGSHSNVDFDRRIQSGSMKFLISLCIAVVNSLLPWVLNRILTYNERQSTIPRQKLSAMIKIFFSVLINTSFVIVIVNANFQDFKVHVVMRMIDSRFKDYSRDWYLEVGFSIMLSMLLCAFSPHAVWCVYYKAKVWCLGAVQSLFDTQLAYNHWAIGADLDLPLAVAMQLVVIFTCFMYSGGMPLMLPICCISLFLMYICTLYILRYVRKPKEHSTILHTWFVNLLPWSIIAHSMFSAYMFGAENIFPSESPSDWYAAMGFSHDFPFNREDYLKDVYNSYDQRATNYCGKTFLCLGFAAFLLGLLNPFLQKALAKRMGLDSRSLSQILRNGTVQGGSSYYIFRNENYEQFYTGVFQHEAYIDEEGEEMQPVSPCSEPTPEFI